MAWLLVDDQVVAPLQVAATPSARRKGLLGRQGIEGALLLSPARSIHTFAMKFTIDVAHLDAELRVLTVTTIKPNRLGRLVWRARHVLEAEQGMLQHFGVVPGVPIAIRQG